MSTEELVVIDESKIPDLEPIEDDQVTVEPTEDCGYASVQCIDTSATNAEPVIAKKKRKTMEDVNLAMLDKAPTVTWKDIALRQDKTLTKENIEQLDKDAVEELRRKYKKLTKKENDKLRKDWERAQDPVVNRLKNAKAPEKSLEEKKAALRAKIEAYKNKRKVVTKETRGPTLKQKKKMANQIEKEGLPSVLSKMGIDDDNVQAVIQQAMATGDIRNPQLMSMRINEALTRSAMEAQVAQPQNMQGEQSGQSGQEELRALQPIENQKDQQDQE